MKNNINLILGDCLKEMKKLPDTSVDLVFTDPPYNLDWKDSIKFKTRKDMFHHKKETEKWDGDFDIRKFYNDIFSIFDRITKQSGSILIFTRSEYVSYAVESALANNFENKATIIWHKTNPMPQVRKKNYLSSIETILWVARHADKCPFTFNFKLQNEMHNFIEMPLCGGLERTIHPTQKPLNLIKHLMQIHSDKNNLVCDPFMGSCTTGVACKELGRRFIGMEIDKKYFSIAEKRMINTQESML